MTQHSATSAREQPAGRPYAFGVVLILMLLNALNYVDRQILAVLVVPIKAELDLTNFQIGLMTGLAFATFYALFGIPIAWLADRGNRVWILMASLVTWSGATALCGMAQNFTQLFIARVGVGVGEAGCTPAAQSLIGDYVPKEKRASALSFYSLGIPLGSFMGLAAGGVIAQSYGWRAAFFIVGIPGVLVALALPFLLKEPRRTTTAAREPVAPAAEVIRTLLRSRAYLHVMAACSLTSLLNFGSSYFLGFFFNVVHGRSLAETGLQLAIVSGVGWSVGIFLGGYLADRALQRGDKAGYARIPAWALISGVPFALAGYLTGGAAIAMLLLIVPTALNSFVFGPGYAVVQGVSAPRSRAMSLAIFMLVANLVGIGLGPALVGGLTDLLSNHFLGGDFGVLCDNVRAVAGTPCQLAEASARRYALAATSLLALWAAFHLFRAGRALPAELIH